VQALVARSVIPKGEATRAGLLIVAASGGTQGSDPASQIEFSPLCPASPTNLETGEVREVPSGAEDNINP
jgi:hypothetical protein